MRGYGVLEGTGVFLAGKYADNTGCTDKPRKAGWVLVALVLSVFVFTLHLGGNNNIIR